MGAPAAPGVSHVGEHSARMVDVGFAIECDELPRDHRRALAAALQSALPWLGDLPGIAVHRLNLSAGGSNNRALLSRRTRLTLRVPRERVADLLALSGQTLQLGTSVLRLGAAQQRELLPHGTLYAHLVVADEADERSFLRAMDEELSALGASCRPICGRHQVVESGVLQGFSLMLDGLSPPAALRVLEAGLGRHRRLGCGVFVPHKSAAAVGS